jgi:hypothetical protein
MLPPASMYARQSHHSATSPALGLCIRTTLSQFSKHSGSNACFIYLESVVSMAWECLKKDSCV